MDGALVAHRNRDDWMAISYIRYVMCTAASQRPRPSPSQMRSANKVRHGMERSCGVADGEKHRIQVTCASRLITFLHLWVPLKQSVRISA